MKKILSFEQEFERRNPKRIQLIRFIREAIGVRETNWQDLTKVNLISVAEHIKECVSPNSARTYFAEIAAFLHRYEDEGIIPCKNPSEVLKCKKVPQQSIYLTEEEMKRIENYYDDLLTKGKHQAEKDVLTLFLLESWTGARVSDCKAMTANNIADGKLSYTSIKTSVLTEVPEHRRLCELIGRIPSKDYSATTINRTLKRVAKKCGITEEVTLFTKGRMQTGPKCNFVSSHVGRKSFCTILARRGVDIYTISAYAGHKNVLQTNHYIVKDTVETPQEALSFFNG